MRAAGPLAENQFENSPLPQAGEGQEVREIRPSSAALSWQALFEELAKPQAAESKNTLRWPAIVAMLLLAAMICGLGWLVLGVMAVRWQLLRSRPVDDGELLELVDVLRAKLGCRRQIEIRQCDNLVTAATVGWLRPVILLPIDWADMDRRSASCRPGPRDCPRPEPGFSGPALRAIRTNAALLSSAYALADEPFALGAGIGGRCRGGERIRRTAAILDYDRGTRIA